VLRLAVALAALLAVAPAALASSTSRDRVASAEWQYAATGVDRVPERVLHAARAVTIAIVDTGADVNAPALSGRIATAYDSVDGSRRVADASGHGTFVASLAAGRARGDGAVAGFGGDARLLVVKVSSRPDRLRDLDVADAIVWAVDHGARIVNLSLSGPTVSAAERAALRYAVNHGVLVVAAAGNAYLTGNRPQYPAAFASQLASARAGGAVVAVAASTRDGGHAAFSSAGSYVDLAAPGDDVVGALAARSSRRMFAPLSLPGVPGRYGVASGTSFAAPEVAGAAALVWAADPGLTAAGVASLLEQTASGDGSWNAELGYGVIDVGSAVGAAQAAHAQAAPDRPSGQ
jgi:subtilisin family serine protease